MLAAIEPEPVHTPALEADGDEAAGAWEATPRSRRPASPQETARRRAQMAEQGAIVAERHRHLRQRRS